MSLDIDQIALHQMIKCDEQALKLMLRDTLLDVSPAAEEMMVELHSIYTDKSKAYGVFTHESELADAVRSCRREIKTFLPSGAPERLYDELAKYPFAEGGTVLFYSIVT